MKLLKLEHVAGCFRSANGVVEAALWRVLKWIPALAHRAIALRIACCFLAYSVLCVAIEEVPNRRMDDMNRSVGAKGDSVTDLMYSKKTKGEERYLLFTLCTEDGGE